MVLITFLLETSEKKAQEQKSKLKICTDGQGVWEGYGNILCQKSKTGSKRKSAASSIQVKEW